MSLIKNEHRLVKRDVHGASNDRVQEVAVWAEHKICFTCIDTTVIRALLLVCMQTVADGAHSSFLAMPFVYIAGNHGKIQAGKHLIRKKLTDTLVDGYLQSEWLHSKDTLYDLFQPWPDPLCHAPGRR